jgi:hypothetical protein
MTVSSAFICGPQPHRRALIVRAPPNPRDVGVIAKILDHRDAANGKIREMQPLFEFKHLSLAASELPDRMNVS